MENIFLFISIRLISYLKIFSDDTNNYCCCCCVIVFSLDWNRMKAAVKYRALKMSRLELKID